MTKTPKRSGDLANGETGEGEPAPPTSRDSVANALDRWDEEGGAPAVSWPLPYEPSDLLDVKRRVLECLGAALVIEWNDLPTDVQRRLFEHAASGKSHDAALLKARIARFLHNHKDDWAEGHRRLAGPSIPRGGKTLLAALALGFRWATETADIPSAVFCRLPALRLLRLACLSNVLAHGSNWEVGMILNRDRYDEARHSSCRRDMIIIEQKVSGFNMFRVLAPTAERTVESGSPSRKSRTEPHDGGRLRRLPRARFSAATKLTAPHTPRVPRATLDQAALQSAAAAFARGEIDRAELMRRISR